MVKSVVKPLIRRILRERIVPNKSVFTRAFGVFCFEIPWGRCLAPKASALPTALHPDYSILFLYKVALYALCNIVYFTNVFRTMDIISNLFTKVNTY